MNCRETIERLTALLDRELNDAEVREVHGHLELCPPCVRLFRFEGGVRRLVKICCSEERASDAFRERLGRAIRECQ